MVEQSDCRPVPSGLSGSILKLIALAAMTADHAAMIFLHEGTVYAALRFFGRLAAPIMCCMLAEGYLHTSSLKNYFARLSVFALLSQVPYSLAVHGTAFEHRDWNMLATLTLSLAAIALFDRTKNPILKPILPLFPIALCCFSDWGAAAPLYALAFYAAGGNRSLRFICTVAVSAVYAAVNFLFAAPASAAVASGVLLAPALLYFYNGERAVGFERRINKRIFYFYYPAHLAVLVLISACTI